MSLATNLTVRELAAITSMSKSQVQRIIADLVPRLAAIAPRFCANRIVRDYIWRRHRRRRARVEHAIARLKNWRVLRDHRRQARHLLVSVKAVACLDNLTIQLRDNS